MRKLLILEYFINWGEGGYSGQTHKPIAKLPYATPGIQLVTRI